METETKVISLPLFSIHTVEGETGYYAIRNNTPLFCLHADSIADALLEAEQAMALYRKFLAKKSA